MNLQDTFAKLWEKIGGWIEQLILMVPNALIAAMVLVFFWIVAGVVKTQSLRLLNRFGRSPEVNWLASIVLYVLVLLGGFVVALGAVGLDKTVTSLLAGAGIVGLALALAFQDIGKNVLAGVYLALRRTIKAGDLVTTNDHFGVIRGINLRATHIDTPEGQLVVIPNREVFQNPVVKFSTGMRRIDLRVGVSYGDDLDKVREVALSAVREVEGRDASREPELFFEEFGSSSIDFVVRFWIPFERQSQFLRARSDAIVRIKKAFDAAGITIPFPIRTLDFGIVGGERLASVIEKTGLARIQGLSEQPRLDDQR
jgi:small conductance mechanosensitive channel